MLLQDTATTIVTAINVYRDWTFWSFVVAAVALATSLAGPLRRLLKATRLIMEVHQMIALDQRLGNPQANLYIDLRNTGGRDIRVKAMSITLTRDGSESKVIDGQVYFETTSSQQQLLLVPFSIKSGESWAHPVKFYALPNRQLDQVIRVNISKLKENILHKKEAIEPSLRSSTLVIADDKFVDPFVELFNKRFYWTPGEYVAKIDIVTDPAKGCLSKSFRFVIYEAEAAELKREVESYNYGGGVYFDSDKHAAIFPPISVV
jgi:hypothetical protein